MVMLMIVRSTRFALLIVVCMAGPSYAGDAGLNLFAKNPGGKILLLVSDQPDDPQEYAATELVRHVEKTTGVKPRMVTAGGVQGERLSADANVIVLGRTDDNPWLKSLAKDGFFQPNVDEQGYSLRIDVNPDDGEGKRWLVVLAGTDPRGVLYAVRDFCHFHFYNEADGVMLRRGRVATAPALKVRMLSESCGNLFSADNDHEGFMHTAHLNRFSRNVVFNKQYFVDWLSEWKVSHVNFVWGNFAAYREPTKEFVAYAHARGVRVFVHYVPYRPGHEDPPPTVTATKLGSDNAADCPRDPAVRKWYMDRLTELVTQEPRFDGVIIESPYHDGVYCKCEICQGKKNPFPEDVLLAEMTEIVRGKRPDMPIVRVMKQPVPDAATAERLAGQLKPLEGPLDWHVNTYRDREHRKRWHDLGPKFGTYLRLYRSALKGKDVPAEIDFLYNDFRMSAERNVLAHGFCYRFYGGRYGSFPVEKDQAMLARYPDKRGPLSLALLGEAASDPLVNPEFRHHKLRRIHAITIPDYPRDRVLTADELTAKVGAKRAEKQPPAGPVVQSPAFYPKPTKLFRYQYGIREDAFTLVQSCVDFDNDGTRELVYGSRTNQTCSLIRATDGKALWTTPLAGLCQSISAHDLDGDGRYEILFLTSNPGRLYILDHSGRVLKHWDADDAKVGNTPVIIDADHDGVLDGYLGTRSKYLVRLNMNDVSLIARRPGWVQCGCHTTAMDVDGDGRWDLFAGAGDDNRAKGVMHRLDPLTLKTVWSHETNDNASSADPVLVDIDGDGQVEIVKSVDNYGRDDAHDGVYAFETDGRLLWKVDGLSGEDSPNVTDLDGDGSVEIVGMTFGSEVYCLDAQGDFKWRKDLRPQLTDRAHAYMAPILCDLDGEPGLEILAMTNAGYTQKGTAPLLNAQLFALSPEGEILDVLDMGGSRYWGKGFCCNVDDDPYLELVVSGSGGLDVVETRGLGPNTEHFERRRDYRRLSVLPWAYEDTYFIHRGEKRGLVNGTDDLILEKTDDHFRETGSFTTELLTPPPGVFFNRLRYEVHTPAGTNITVDIVDESGQVLKRDVASGVKLRLEEAVRLRFRLSTSDRAVSPRLDGYGLSFDR
ncbi:MAG: hypothetical protein CMJ48_10665 [Planctomycetaceae bacterium]|nr:hypothetical protein [Planctomycetaceae bacterium]